MWVPTAASVQTGGGWACQPCQGLHRCGSADCCGLLQPPPAPTCAYVFHPSAWQAAMATETMIVALLAQGAHSRHLPPFAHHPAAAVNAAPAAACAGGPIQVSSVVIKHACWRCTSWQVHTQNCLLPRPYATLHVQQITAVCFGIAGILGLRSIILGLQQQSLE